MNDEIKGKLSQYIAKNILKKPSRIIPEDEPLISSGMIDSFHLIDLAIYVEDTFGVTIDDAELNAETFDTLQQLAEIIDHRK